MIPASLTAHDPVSLALDQLDDLSHSASLLCDEIEALPSRQGKLSRVVDMQGALLRKLQGLRASASYECLAEYFHDESYREIARMLDRVVAMSGEVMPPGAEDVALLMRASQRIRTALRAHATRLGRQTPPDVRRLPAGRGQGTVMAFDICRSRSLPRSVVEETRRAGNRCVARQGGWFAGDEGDALLYTFLESAPAVAAVAAGLEFLHSLEPVTYHYAGREFGRKEGRAASQVSARVMLSHGAIEWSGTGVSGSPFVIAKDVMNNRSLYRSNCMIVDAATIEALRAGESPLEALFSEWHEPGAGTLAGMRLWISRSVGWGRCESSYRRGDGPWAHAPRSWNRFAAMPEHPCAVVREAGEIRGTLEDIGLGGARALIPAGYEQEGLVSGASVRFDPGAGTSAEAVILKAEKLSGKGSGLRLSLKFAESLPPQMLQKVLGRQTAGG